MKARPSVLWCYKEILLSLNTLQYIRPNEHPMLTQAELLVIDEAAAIPLPVINSLLGPYMIFLSKTVNG